MNEFIHGVVRAAAETFDFPEPILEVGSFQVDGQEHLGNLRAFFPGKRYTGIDIRRGPGVDSVEDVESLRRVDASVGSVIALNVFEHVQQFWRGFEEVQRILRPDGLLIVSCPFQFHIHAYPNDYWRFTPEALRLLLDRLPGKIIGYHGPPKRPLSVWALAVGANYPRITAADHTRFQDLIRHYARQQLRWDKRLRYRIGRLICGSRPFASLLDAESFETQLIQAA